MSHFLNLDEVDVDGAVREAADAVSGDTRLSFLKKAGLGTGAVMSGGAVLAAFAPSAFASSGRPPASFGPGDVGILNYALTLEYLEAAFYNTAIANGVITDPGLKALAAKITTDENTHVAFLQKGLGRAAVKSPKFDFGSAVTSQASFAATSMALENTGVSAYFGQGFNIKSSAYLKDAISILTIEARHAGAIGYYLDAASGAAVANSVSPEGAFDKPRTAAEVLTIVKGTGFIV